MCASVLNWYILLIASDEGLKVKRPRQWYKEANISIPK